MIRYGIVSNVFYNKGTVIVEFPDLNIPSDELIVFQGRTHSVKYYSMPKIGEIGLCLLNETGTSGYYLGAGFSGKNPLPANAGEGKYITLYPDSTTILFDENSSKLYIDCKKEIEIICPNIVIAGNIKITGDVAIDGSLNVTKNINAEGGMESKGDVKAGNISLKSHRTSGVKAGADISGLPVE